jgi:hypothetical protein
MTVTTRHPTQSTICTVEPAFASFRSGARSGAAARRLDRLFDTGDETADNTDESRCSAAMTSGLDVT